MAGRRERAAPAPTRNSSFDVVRRYACGQGRLHFAKSAAAHVSILGPMQSSPTPDVPPALDPRFLDRVRQVQWDHYYMSIARTVATRANCTGSRVGAVLVGDNRIIATGFNGTPAGFPNCLDGGCVRCRDRALFKAGRIKEMADKSLARGPKQLDICICVHAEANALLSAARAGTRTDRAVLYATHKPCFTCLKEAIQAGVERVVYLNDYVAQRLRRERQGVLPGAVRTPGRTPPEQRRAQLRAALSPTRCVERHAGDRP